MSKQKTAKEKIMDLLNESKGVKTSTLLTESNLNSLLKRDLASYNDRVTKAGHPESRVSAAGMLKDLKANPTRENIYKILKTTGTGYVKEPPKETEAGIRDFYSGKVKYESPKKKAKRELKEKTSKGFSEYIEGKGFTKYKQKKQLGIEGISDFNKKKLGRIFQELREKGLIGKGQNQLPSDVVVNRVLQAEEVLDRKVSPTKILSWLVHNTEDIETAKTLNLIFGQDIFEIGKDGTAEINEEAFDKTEETYGQELTSLLDL